MNSIKDTMKVMILGDNFSRQFIHHARPLIDEFGYDGEKAVREGVRRYGRDRGVALRQKHMDQGYKINLKTIFGGKYDLPGDPRVDKRTLVLTEQVRRALVYACPIAEVWAEMNATETGRIYCEEFHHAMWETYAAGTQVNLTQTLTQEGDDCCNFSVYQRPSNISSKTQLAEAFPEFDPDYKEPEENSPQAKVTPQKAYEELCLRLFQEMNLTAMELISDTKRVYSVLSKSAEAMAEDFATNIVEKLKSGEPSKAVSLAEAAEYSPFGTKEQNIKAWQILGYKDSAPEKIMQEHFFSAFEKAVDKN